MRSTNLYSTSDDLQQTVFEHKALTVATVADRVDAPPIHWPVPATLHSTSPRAASRGSREPPAPPTNASVRLNAFATSTMQHTAATANNSADGRMGIGALAAVRALLVILSIIAPACSAHLSVFILFCVVLCSRVIVIATFQRASKTATLVPCRSPSLLRPPTPM